MKKTTLIVLLALGVFFQSCKDRQVTPPDIPDNPKPTETEESKWELVWEDNFDAEKLDTEKWVKVPRGKPDWQNYMSSEESLHLIRDGYLVLRGIKNNIAANDTAEFLTGGVWTRDKKTFSLGRVDVKARFESGGGFWPAIWMNAVGKPWPYGGEIDLMEHLNFENSVYQTVHSGYTINVSGSNPMKHTHRYVNIKEFNTYSVEVYEDKLVFLINNKVTHTYPNIGKENQYPFTRNEYIIILSAQLGGGWVGTVNPDDLPVEMEIDWVKFYKQKN